MFINIYSALLRAACQNSSKRLSGQAETSSPCFGLKVLYCRRGMIEQSAWVLYRLLIFLCVFIIMLMRNKKEHGHETHNQTIFHRYHSHHDGIPCFGLRGWYCTKSQRLRHMVGLGDEPFHLCRLDAVCDGGAACRWSLSDHRGSYCAYGKCQTPVLWNLHDR